ncbi:hypothetical protein J6590_065577 [Homalodisca vitripennis]|nr:hypothetical protein J6590_065577 [Homalodisca vitripennis]
MSATNIGFILQAICKCKNECKTISSDWKLNTDFYNLEDNVKQNNLLMGLLILIPVKRRRHGNYTNEKDSRRQCTICFTLPNEGGGVFSVCKQTFLDTFSINKRRVETLVSAKKLGMTSYTEKELADIKREDRFDMFGKNVAAKLRSLPQEQRIYAEKEINDALFDAEVGALQQISTFNMSNAFFPPTQPNYQQQTSQSQSLPTQFPGLIRYCDGIDEPEIFINQLTQASVGRGRSTSFSGLSSKSKLAARYFDEPVRVLVFNIVACLPINVPRPHLIN